MNISIIAGIPAMSFQALSLDSISLSTAVTVGMTLLNQWKAFVIAGISAIKCW
jgi:hypothetical protein